MVRIQAVGQKDEVGDGISFMSGDGIYKGQIEVKLAGGYKSHEVRGSFGLRSRLCASDWPEMEWIPQL